MCPTPKSWWGRTIAKAFGRQPYSWSQHESAPYSIKTRDLGCICCCGFETVWYCVAPGCCLCGRSPLGVSRAKSGSHRDNVACLSFAILELCLLPTVPPGLPSSAPCAARHVWPPPSYPVRKGLASCVHDGATRVKRDNFSLCCVSRGGLSSQFT